MKDVMDCLLILKCTTLYENSLMQALYQKKCGKKSREYWTEICELLSLLNAVMDQEVNCMHVKYSIAKDISYKDQKTKNMKT